VRLFIAINFPALLRTNLHEATKPLRDAAPTAKWVDTDRLHLTIRFLGQQPESTVAPLVDALRAVGKRFDPIALELGGLGAFPNLRRPRVVWMGVKGDPKLELLHHDVETACGELGFEVEGRPFRPHLTLARAGDPRIDAVALTRAAKTVDFSEEIMIDALDVMVSEHADGKPRYRLLGSATLRRE
jgi:2'-5' RNA ligase